MYNPENLTKWGKQDGRQTKQILHNTICVGHHYAQTNTINVNKTRALLQTTGDKDEPNIIFIQTSQHGAQNVKTHNRTTEKTKKMSNTDPTNKTKKMSNTDPTKKTKKMSNTDPTKKTKKMNNTDPTKKTKKMSNKKLG
jgi:hypothetical protein